MNVSRMPGFTAESSVYKVSGTYRTVMNFGAIGFQVPLNSGVIPEAMTVTCGTCYRDDQGNCVADCIRCPAGAHENGCEDPFTRACPSGEHCCSPGQADCRMKDSSGRTIGQCCSGDQVCTDDGCCPKDNVCGDRCGCPGAPCSPVDGCCQPGEVICGDGKCCPPSHPGAGVRWTNYPNLFPTPTVYKWLVVECQLADVPNIPAGLDTNIRQFLGSAGTGYGNIVDYYHDVSYNGVAFAADFLGWVPAPFTLADTTDQRTPVGGPNKRAERVRRCLEAIPSNKVPDFASYYGVIAIGNAQSEGGACHIGQQSMTINNKPYNLACVYFDSSSLWIDFAAHEIGHGLGLNHSFDNAQNICAIGSTVGQYCDPWDIMSAMVTYQFNSGNWKIGDGPGMSGPNLLRMGWIPIANMRRYDLEAGGEQIFTIGALSHPQGDQPIVVLLDVGFGPSDGVYTVEYRQGDGWDRGIVNGVTIPSINNPLAPTVAKSQGGAVLVHQYRPMGEPAATLVENGNTGALVKGDLMLLRSAVGPVYHVTVQSIDTTTASATVSIGPGSA